MSNTPTSKKKERKKKATTRKVQKVAKSGNSEALTREDVVSLDQNESTFPANQSPLPIPPVDKATVNNIEKLIEVSYLSYLKELKKKDVKDDCNNIGHLNNILSEFLGPFLLIGYMPDDEPIEILNATTAKDREAVLERLRKTFIRHMNSAIPE